MKLRKTFAGILASAIAVSAMTVAASAAATTELTGVETDDQGNIVATLFGTDESGAEIGFAAEAGIDVTTIYGVEFKTTLDPAEWADESVWIGGGIGWVSESHAWDGPEWGRSGKDILVTENGDVKLLEDAPLFTADDTYGKVYFAAWGGTVVVDSIDILGADGSVLLSIPSGGGTTTDDTDDITTDDTTDDTTNDTTTDNGTGTTNPPTGIALTIIPALLTGSALTGAGVILKRRK